MQALLSLPLYSPTRVVGRPGLLPLPQGVPAETETTSAATVSGRREEPDPAREGDRSRRAPRAAEPGRGVPGPLRRGPPPRLGARPRTPPGARPRRLPSPDPVGAT